MKMSTTAPVTFFSKLMNPVYAQFFAFIFFFTGMTSAVIARDLELLDLVNANVGICAEINHLEDKIDQIKDSTIINRFCESLIYQEWRSSDEYEKVQKGRNIIEAITDRSIEEVIKALFGKSTIIALFPDNDKWSALLLTEAKDTETLKELIDIWIKTGSHETEELDFLGSSYHRRFKSQKDGSTEDCVYYIQHNEYFALSASENKIHEVIELYSISEKEGINSKEFKALSLGFSEEYLSAKNSLTEDCFSYIYLNPQKMDHLIGRHLKNSKEFVSLYELWNNLKSSILGFRIDKNSFAFNLSLIQKEDASSSSKSEFTTRMQGPSTFLSKVPQNALLAISGKLHLKNVEKLITDLIKKKQDKKGHKNLENVRQVSRGLLLGLDLFDDIFPALKPDWGAYLVAKEKPDSQTIPVDAIVTFQLPDNDTVVKNGGRVSLKTALDNGFNTGLNLLAAFYNSEKSGQPAIVRTEQNNASILRWIDSIYSYLPSFGINQRDLIIASHPDLIRNYVSKTSDKTLSNDLVLQEWMEKYSTTENQWLILNLKEAHSYFSIHRDYFIKQTIREEKISQEKAATEIDDMTSIARTFDFCMFGFHLDKNKAQVLFGATCEK